MTTSEPARAGTTGAFVWVWLPGATDPVVAGRLLPAGQSNLGQVLAFTYGRSYLARADAISLFTPELPLQPGTVDPTAPPTRGREPMPLAGCLRDAAPDAWGRRVLNLRLGEDQNVELSELTYLLASDSDRIGALDFQVSATEYVRRGGDATLDQLMTMAELAEAGIPIPDDLADAAGHGTSIGGARPKALLRHGDRQLIAKFSSSTDDRPVVKAEAAAMALARELGIDAAGSELVRVRGKDVLLVDRFDRTVGGGRRQLVSALTILGLGEMSARYGSYPMLADAIKTSFAKPGQALRELYTRLVFNVCIGNNDDHLRNHAAFWDGTALELTPAYDLAPQPRRTAVSTQAIGLTDSGERASQLWACRKAAGAFRVGTADADAVIDHVVSGIRRHWEAAADAAELTRAERDTLLGREILNPYVFYDQP